MSGSFDWDITDEWTPREWRVVCGALEKTPERYRELVPALTRAVRALGFPGPGTRGLRVLDIGCAEGAFTHCWLSLLQGLGYRCERVMLCEPDRELLGEAQLRLEASWPEVEFVPVNEYFNGRRFRRHRKRFDLVILSHVVYYWKDQEIKNHLKHITSQLLAPESGALWLIVRNRDCGLYQHRSDLLRDDAQTEDPQAHYFADHVLDIVSGEGHVYLSHRHEFKLRVDHLSRDDQLAAFQFLTHLRGHSPASAARWAPRDDTWEFAETHVFLTRQAAASTPEAASADERALRLLAELYCLLHGAGYDILDLQLARLKPQEGESKAEPVYGAERYHARPIRGRITLWGLNAQSRERDLFFQRYPSFLLYDAFYSAEMSPWISEPRWAEPSSVGAPSPRNMCRLKDQAIEWRERYDKISFSHAWTDWKEIVAPSEARSSDPNGGLQIRCFAVPARLARLERDASESELSDSSAAIFGTLAWRGEGEGPEPLRGTLAHVRAALSVYLGEAVVSALTHAQKILERKEKEREHALTLSSRLAQKLQETQEPLNQLRLALQQDVETVLGLSTNAKLRNVFTGARFHDPPGSLEKGKEFIRELRKAFEQSSPAARIVEDLARMDRYGRIRHALFEPWIRAEAQPYITEPQLLLVLWLAATERRHQSSSEDGRRICYNDVRLDGGGISRLAARVPALRNLQTQVRKPAMLWQSEPGRRAGDNRQRSVLTGGPVALTALYYLLVQELNEPYGSAWQSLNARNRDGRIVCEISLKPSLPSTALREDGKRTGMINHMRNLWCFLNQRPELRPGEEYGAHTSRSMEFERNGAGFTLLRLQFGNH